MKNRKLLSLFMPVLLCLCLLASCTTLPGGNSASSNAASSSGNSAVNVTTDISAEVKTVDYEDDDYAFDWKNASHTTIILSGSSIVSDGADAAVSGSSVTVRASGTYVIQGTLDDGSIIVDVDKSLDEGTVFLILNGADITSLTSAPIYIKDAKKVTLILADGTTNSMRGGSGCVVNADGEPSAAVFSKADLSIAGSGKLTVTAECNDGITSKDDLKITGGTLVIDAASDGIVGKDSLNVENASITIQSGKDGMRSTNDTDAGVGNVVIQGGTFDITSEGDAISAVTALIVSDGTLNLTSGGGYPGQITHTGGDNGFGGMKPGGQNGFGTTTAATAATASDTQDGTVDSMKGLKSSKYIVISGGTIAVSSYEDGIHSDGDISVQSGDIDIEAGDDAVHAEGNIAIDGVDLNVTSCYEAIEGANVTISGKLICLVSSDDGFNINNEQGTLTINGGEIKVDAGGDGLDSNGNIVMTGGTVYIDGPINDGNGAVDYYSDFTISGGTLVASGSSGMAEAPTDRSEQCSILMFYDAVQSAGTAITLKDSDGNTVASFTPAKQYSSVAISSPLLEKGSTYSLYAGDSKVADITLSDTVTYPNGSGGMNPGGMNPGGMNPGGTNPGGGFTGPGRK